MNLVILISFVFLFGGFLGYCLGNTKKGSLVNYTNQLPNGFLRVISVDKTSSVLEEVSPKRRRFLVSTKVFGGQAIRPLDIVRKIAKDKERKDLGIPVLGYPPLIRDSIKESL